MTGTNVEIKLDQVLDRLNQVTDRLSEIEMILNNPMHGVDMPEGVNLTVDPWVNSIDPYNISSVDVKLDSLVDFDEGIQLNLKLDGDNK